MQRVSSSAFIPREVRLPILVQPIFGTHSLRPLRFAGWLQVYDSQKGAFADLGVLDVQQIFGPAGRPQFDTRGAAHLLTTHDKLAHYLAMLTHSRPIESQFARRLPDNLNAEVVLGTVASIREASTWLSYSYLFVRMGRNPLPYGMTLEELAADPQLVAQRRSLLEGAAQVCSCLEFRLQICTWWHNAEGACGGLAARDSATNTARRRRAGAQGEIMTCMAPEQQIPVGCIMSESVHTLSVHTQPCTVNPELLPT